MNDRKPSRAYLAVKAIVRLVFGKMEVEGLENLPQGGVVIVGNHAQMNGPIACELYLGDNRYTWCIGEMMRLKEVPAYAYRDFWSQKPRCVRWLFKIAAYLIAPLSVFIFNNANTIPVYHDTRVVMTFRETLRKLQKDARVVIFPERDAPYNNILCEFQEGFVDVAKMYYGLTKKELAFVPMYIAPRLRKMLLGKPILFRHDAPYDEERQRVCDELKAAITGLAQSLPRHVVVPYRNISKKEYPFSLPE
ncbi:MAG: hypothetical protein IJ157_13140 [Clostridia bacterium]|nr:hypothetical protein [Clostridia bacterium]